MATGLNHGLRTIWSWRRWIYAAWMLIAATRIPARTGFRLERPACDLRLTLDNLALSVTKVPHIILFGAFFFLTALQFNRLDRRALAWGLVATGMLGLLVEVEEGATRTGNCRITDVTPDLLGALVVAALVIGAVAVRNRLRLEPGSSTER